jgi:hypothetical protein
VVVELEVRLLRLAVLLPRDHPLAALEAVPLARLRDADVCWRAGTQVSAEWEQAVRQADWLELPEGTWLPEPEMTDLFKNRGPKRL